MRDRRTEYFAYADFAGPLKCIECCQSEQSERGDENGERCKDQEQLAFLLFAFVKLAVRLAEECISKRYSGCEGLPHLFNVLKALLHVSGINGHRHSCSVIIPPHVEYHGYDGFMQRFKVKVLHHADNPSFTTSVTKELAGRIVYVPADHAHGRLIQDKCGCVVAQDIL